jgi:hypothetical protein
MVKKSQWCAYWAAQCAHPTSQGACHHLAANHLIGATQLLALPIARILVLSVDSWPCFSAHGARGSGNSNTSGGVTNYRNFDVLKTISFGNAKSQVRCISTTNLGVGTFTTRIPCLSNIRELNTPRQIHRRIRPDTNYDRGGRRLILRTLHFPLLSTLLS